MTRTARRWNPALAAPLFAVGSTMFSWLLLRGRLIPMPRAWLGVAAPLLLGFGLPLQLAGFAASPFTDRTRDVTPEEVAA